MHIDDCLLCRQYSLHLHHSLFSNPSATLPTSQLILQPFRCFNYVTVHSPTLLSLLLHHRLFTYITWRATHVLKVVHLHHRQRATKCRSETWRVPGQFPESTVPSTHFRKYLFPDYEVPEAVFPNLMIPLISIYPNTKFPKPFYRFH